MAAWRPPEDEEVAWVLEVVGCKRSHLGDMSEDEFRYIYSNEYHVVLVGDSRDPFAFFFEVCWFDVFIASFTVQFAGLCDNGAHAQCQT